MEAMAIAPAEMIDAAFPVTESDGRTRSRECTATRIGADGMEIRTEAVPATRFAWLEFHIPGSGHRVKALGEVIACIAGEGATRVILHFKHLFPRDRAALAHWLVAPRVAA
ncbi:MAG: hypothetical protein FJ087_10050 [Deltaproteobacteria bacterium]|nr:hypothetical protein [Deltaproteobacteria bacterium]